jgi:uncharacterized membrane protein (UPF0127 family)
MPRLAREGEVLAPVEVADTRRARRRGLLGRDHVDRPLVLRSCRQVHTVGMRVPIDVVWCDAGGRVLRTARVAPGRITRPVWSARLVIEAAAGAVGRWDVRPGQVLRLEPDHIGPDHIRPDHIGPDHIGPDHIRED